MSTRKSDLPRALEPVIARALAERPEDRYATATEFAVAVTNAANGMAAAAAPVAAAAAPVAAAATTPQDGSRVRDSTIHLANSRRSHLLRLVLTLLASLVLFGGTALALIASDLSGRVATETTPAGPRQSAEPTLSPTTRPSSTSAPALVTLSAEELLLPLSELPFAGYKVSFDNATSQTGWARRYLPTDGAATLPTYYAIGEVYPTAAAASDSLRKWLLACPSVRSSSPVGDSSGACVLRLATTPASFLVYLYVVTRNVSVLVSLLDSPPFATESAAEASLPRLVALAVAQLDRIDRIARVDGVAVLTPSPATTARLVTLRPEQIVLPLAEFPLSRYAVGADGVQGDSWFRSFTDGLEGTALHRRFDLQLYVRPAVVEAEAAFAGLSRCERYGVGKAQPLDATIGEESGACLYSKELNSWAFVEVFARSRNVVVTVSTFTDDFDGRVKDLVAIARAQVSAIDRVSPR